MGTKRGSAAPDLVSSLSQSVLNGFGVQTKGNQLVVEASERNLGQRLHTLIQAMLAINDMFVMAQPRVAGFFWEDVSGFLDDSQIRYVPRVKLSGRSGFDHDRLPDSQVTETPGAVRPGHQRSQQEYDWDLSFCSQRHSGGPR